MGLWFFYQKQNQQPLTLLETLKRQHNPNYLLDQLRELYAREAVRETIQEQQLQKRPITHHRGKVVNLIEYKVKKINK
jgi:hypothetical protein